MYKYSEPYSIKKEKLRMWHRIVVINILLAFIIAMAFMSGWYCSKIYHWKVCVESEQSPAIEENSAFMQEIQKLNGCNQ